MRTSISCLIVAWHKFILPKMFWLFFACLALITCKQLEPDRSYLESIPCTAPCWQDITPGITDETTAMTILSNPNLINQETFDCQTSSDNPSQSFCSFRRVSNEGGGVGFENGIVTRIRLKTEVTLEETISAFGSPDFVNVIHGSQIVNEGKCYRADIYYLKGIFLFVSGCESIEFPLEVVSGNNLRTFPDMQVISVDFLPPSDTLETTLLYRLGHSNIQGHLNNIQTWTGFGLYSLPPKE